MWRPFVWKNSVSRVYRVLAAAENAVPVAEQRRFNSNIKMTKTLKKLMDKRSGTKKKKSVYGPFILSSSTHQDRDLNPQKKPQYSEGQKRRAVQVGRVLYDNIVRIINTGELSPQLAALSVEIVKVHVVPNFSALNVYWLCSGSKQDDEVERLLRENEGFLRHLLSSYHLLSTIPRINFIRDMSQASYQVVVSLLDKADFGPDFVSSHVPHPKEKIPSVDTLQSQFDQLSFQHSVETARNYFSGTRPSVRQEGLIPGEERGNEGSCHTAFGCSSSSAEVDATSGSVEERTLQKQASSGLSNQPCSLDIEKLSSQFLSASASTGSTTDIDNTASNQNAQSTMMEGFRDDLYGVRHTEIMNKILIRRQKAGIRQPSHQHENELDAVMLQASSFKALPKKKWKEKGRNKSLTDYYHHKDTIDSLSNRQKYKEEEEEIYSDGEFDGKEVVQTADDFFYRR